MTACTPIRWAARSVGIATWPSAWPLDGHEVTYLTLRQWDRGETPEPADGRVKVVSAGPRMSLYTATAGDESHRR